MKKRILIFGNWLSFHFVIAYIASGENSVEKEYERLKNQNK